MGITIQPSGPQGLSPLDEGSFTELVISVAASAMWEVHEAHVLREKSRKEETVGNSWAESEETPSIFQLPTEVFVPGQFTGKNEEHCSREEKPGTEGKYLLASVNYTNCMTNLVPVLKLPRVSDLSHVIMFACTINSAKKTCWFVE